MQTFFFPNGEILNSSDVRKSVAIGALCPVGTVAWAGFYAERSPVGWIQVTDSFAETQMGRFARARDRRETTEKVAKAAAGISYKLESRAHSS